MFPVKLKTTSPALVAAGLLASGLLVAGAGAIRTTAAQERTNNKPSKYFKLRAQLEGHGKSVYGLAFSPDGKLLASGSEDNTIKIWDPASGKEVKTLTGHQDAVSSLAFSPDGGSLVSTSSSSTAALKDGNLPDAVKIWDVATWKEKVKLKDNEGRFFLARFSPDGKVLAAMVGGSVKFWETATGKVLGTITENIGLSDLTFSPDSKTLVLASASKNVDDPIRMWNWAEKLRSGSLKSDGACHGLCFTRDGKSLVTWNEYKDLTFWDFEKSQERKTVKLKTAAYRFSMSANEKIVALSLGLGNKVELRDTATGNLLETIASKGGDVNQAVFSANGSMLAVAEGGIPPVGEQPGDTAGVVRIWEILSPAQKRTK